ncbi:MAG: hypothetical protein IPO17_15310 [Flavobacteriales bacterium]|nr:hypothetical protein [Flavobacteriales bacterium]
MLRSVCDRALVPLRDPYNRSVILGTSNKSANRTIHLLRMLLEGQNDAGRLEEMLGFIDYSRDRQIKSVNASSKAAIT